MSDQSKFYFSLYGSLHYIPFVDDVLRALLVPGVDDGHQLYGPTWAQEEAHYQKNVLLAAQACIGEVTQCVTLSEKRRAVARAITDLCPEEAKRQECGHYLAVNYRKALELLQDSASTVDSSV